MIDDGSSDDTIDIVKSYGDRIVLLQQANAGSAAARNTGATAKGTWLAFLDADDLWEPDKLELQLAATGDAAMSHTDWYFFGPEQKKGIRGSDRAAKYSGQVLSELVVNNFIATSTALLRKSAFEEAGGFDTSLRALQDWDLWLKVASRHEIICLDEPLMHYRVHPS